MAVKVTKLGFRSRVMSIFHRRHRPDDSARQSTSANIPTREQGGPSSSSQNIASTTPSPTEPVNQSSVSPILGHAVPPPVFALPTAPIDPSAVTESPTTWPATPLGGHERVAGMLLDPGAHIDTEPGPYGTALPPASPYHAETVEQILLDPGADVNSHGGVFGHTLHAGSTHTHGHDQVVRTLLDNKAHLNAVGVADRHPALRPAQEEGGGDEDDTDFLFYRSKTKVKRIFGKGHQSTNSINVGVSTDLSCLERPTEEQGGASSSRKTPSTNPRPADAVNQATVSATPANGVPRVSAVPTAPVDPSPGHGPPTPAANSSTVVLQSPHSVSSPDFWSPQALWEDAYKNLRTRELELVTEFEKITCGTFTSNEQVQARVQAQLDSRIEDQWVVHVLGKDVRIRKMGEDLIKFLLWSKDLVSSSLTSQPHLALAWSGITMLLPLVLTPTQESDAMIQGLDHLTSILMPYQLRIKLQRNSGSEEYRTAVVHLYSCCLEYQARMACHLSKRSTTRGVLALTECGQWTALVEKIDAADEECTKYQTLVDRQQEDEMWSLQAKHMEDQENILRQIYQLRLDELNAREAEREDLLRDKVIECLVGDYPEQKNANPEAVENTCRWFLDDPRFRKWRGDTTSSLLWLHAGAGCGKSVLSRMLIDKDHLIPAGRAMTSTVCYFFFKNLDNRNSGADALRGILHQLYTQKLHANLISVAYEATKLYKQKLGSMFNTLWDLLLNTAKHPSAGEIICVLDALDECQSDARKALLAKVVQFYNACAKETNGQGPQQPRIKFLITSQYRDDIDLRFAHLDPMSNFIRFPGDDRSDILRQEIDLVIDQLIPEKVPKLNRQSQLLLAQHLKSIDHRTYLWLHLILEEIEEKFPSNSTLTRIKALIGELPNTVNEAYEGILLRSPDPESTRMILQIILAAKRELTVNELITAWHVARSHRLPRSYQDLDLPDEAYRESSLQAICGSFIRIFSPGVYDETLAALYLLNYASENWGGYYGTALQSAAVHGHDDVVEILLTRKPPAEVNTVAGEYVNALQAASAYGHHSVVRILLRHNADVNAAGGYYGNALELASARGYLKVVEMLLDAGAELNTDGADYCKALHLASYHGHEQIVEMLIAHGADIHAQGGDYCNALHAAAEGGHEKLVLTLLTQHKARVNDAGGYHGNALQAAAEAGHERVIQILLDHGAHVNAEGGHYGSPLQAAAALGHERVVGLLLRKGANVHFKGGDFGTAMRAAWEV
ncbi:hypothetical protein DV735_g1500, partial [Chaetothyriales sp. CBS 134920]